MIRLLLQPLYCLLHKYLINSWFKLVNQKHSNYQLYPIRKSNNALKHAIVGSCYQQFKALALLRKQALLESRGIGYSFWLKFIENKSPSLLVSKQQDTCTALSIHFFMFCPDDESLANITRLTKQTIDSLSLQSSQNWHVSLVCQTSIALPFSTRMLALPVSIITYDAATNSNKEIESELCASSASYACIVPVGTQFAVHAVRRLLVAGENIFCDIIYSDDDLISQKLERHSPHFKPDWNPDYFCSFNYLSCAVIVKHSLLSELSYLQSSTLSSFYSLLLANKNKLNPLCIQHIPEVLFHFPENFRDNELIYNEKYFQPSLEKVAPLISIIIPTRDELSILKQCIDSLFSHTSYPNFEVLIIDNQSKEQVTLDYLQTLEANPCIRVLQYPHAFNYSAINNFAVQHASGVLLAFVNNDIECINAEWLSEMANHALRADIGCVGAKLYYPDGTIQHGGVILGIYGTASHAHKGFSGGSSGYFGRLSVVHNVSAVTAACMVVRKELFIEAGGFDEINLTVAYNDVDLCLKILELGYRNLWTPFAELIHYESKSRGKKHTKETRSRLDQEEAFMREKWMKYLENDPAYNINLTLIREDFSLGNYRKVD